MRKETIIILDRSDLNPMHKDTPSYDLTLSFFEVSMRDFTEASVVMFVENEEVTYLKNRYERQ